MPKPRQQWMRNPPPTGRVVRDMALEEGTPPAAMAERLGVDLAELQPVLDGDASVTPGIAIALEDAGLWTADFWMRLQAYYDLAQGRLRREAAECGPAAALQRGPALTS